MKPMRKLKAFVLVSCGQILPEPMSESVLGIYENEEDAEIVHVGYHEDDIKSTIVPVTVTIERREI